ncbi:hypothetical protein ACU8KH_05876 [Lachancea thermotolerans]
MPHTLVYISCNTAALVSFFISKGRFVRVTCLLLQAGDELILNLDEFSLDQ